MDIYTQNITASIPGGSVSPDPQLLNKLLQFVYMEDSQVPRMVAGLERPRASIDCQSWGQDLSVDTSNVKIRPANPEFYTVIVVIILNAT